MGKRWGIVPKKAAGRRKSWLKDFGAVFFVLLFFPYILQMFIHGIDFTREDANSNYSGEIGEFDDTVVILETNIGLEKVPMEEYLVGALAGSMDASYHEEALKAQAVLLRTAVIYQRMERRLDPAKAAEGTDISVLKENEVIQSDLRQNYWNLTQMHRAFGEKYEEQYNRLKNLVEETRSVILNYKGMPVETAFCALTAGATRNGEEAFGGKDYPHLKSVKCESDILSKDYLKTKSFSWEELENVTNAFSLSTESGNTVKLQKESMQVMKKDSLGYALSVKVGDTVLSGEECRKLLHLNSSNMEIEESEEGVTIRTKGLGHGLGMSQYTADYMADHGSDFVQILTYFFADSEIQKN